MKLTVSTWLPTRAILEESDCPSCGSRLKWVMSMDHSDMCNGYRSTCCHQIFYFYSLPLSAYLSMVQVLPHAEQDV